MSVVTPEQVTIEILRAFSKYTNIEAVCHYALTRILGMCGLRHGFLAHRKYPDSDRQFVVALQDPPPRKFECFEIGDDIGEYQREDTGPIIREVFTYGGNDKGVLCLFNDFCQSNTHIHKQLLGISCALSCCLTNAGCLTRLHQTHETFLATMSHEIRSPLNGIVGMARLLRKAGSLNQEEQDWANVTFSCAIQLVEVISDLLDFSRLDSNKVELKNEPLNVSECIQTAMDVVYLKSKQKGLSLQSEVDRHGPQVVMGDAKRLRQILVNLLVNAIKFTLKGTIVVRAHVKNKHLWVEVEDTGTGIEPRHLKRVFSSFVQVSESATGSENEGGLGLGLWICRKLVKLMKGSISIRPCDSKTAGTTVSFNIPVVAVDESDSRNRTYSLEQTSHLVQNKTAVIVDSDNARQLSLFGVLVKLRMVPVAFGTVEEAVQYTAQQQFAFDIAFVETHLVERWESCFESRGVPLVSIGACPSQSISVQGQIMNTSLNLVKALVHDIFQSLPVPRHKRQFSICDARKRLRIMVVEDVPHNVKVMVKTLESLHYTDVCVAHNGFEALDRVKEHAFDVVFMDLRMPGLDGLTVARCILQHSEGTQNTVIVPMTAFVTDQDRERCRAAGMSCFLEKPIDVTALKNILNFVQSSKED